MAPPAASTPQDAARKLLSLFSDRDIPRGGALPLTLIETIFMADRRFGLTGYFDALDYAVYMGWVKSIGDGTIKLLFAGSRQIHRLKTRS